ncbi:MAG: cupredoxin domain-containing protein [Patescibacteria group bacterium]
MNANTKIFAAALVVGLMVFAVVVWWPAESGVLLGGGTEIIMKDKVYTPKNLRIKVGERITFINEDASEVYWPASNIHPTHEIYSEFDPQKPVPTGSSWSFVFNKKGEWRYHDHLFPEITGSIVVE